MRDLAIYGLKIEYDTVKLQKVIQGLFAASLSQILFCIDFVLTAVIVAVCCFAT